MRRIRLPENNGGVVECVQDDGGSYTVEVTETCRNLYVMDNIIKVQLLRKFPPLLGTEIPFMDIAHCSICRQ